MRYILIILVFLSVGANAQMVIKAHANYRPTAQPVTNLLLDDYPNAAAAYSLRKLDKDYTGSCVRIRKDSVGQTEQDFGFTASGYLDTTAIKNFCGTNQGRLVTWYDQSGNSRNISQSVASQQPFFWTGIQFGSLTALANDVRKSPAFTSVASTRLINNFSTINQPITTFSVSRIDNATTGNADVIYDSYNSTQSILYYTGTTEPTNNRWTIASGTALQGTTAGNTSPNIFTTLHNSTSSSIHINGQSYVSGNVGTNGLAGLSVGDIRGNPSPIVSGYGLDGRIAELIIYGSNQSTNITAIENNINSYYSIY